MRIKELKVLLKNMLMVGRMAGSGFVCLLKTDEMRYKLKNATKVILFAFLYFCLVNYMLIMIALISGYIDLSSIIVRDGKSEIYLPFFAYVLSGGVALNVLLNRKVQKILNYKHFCLLIFFIAIEMLIVYMFLGYWIKVNVDIIKELEVIFTPWNIYVEWI